MQNLQNLNHSIQKIIEFLVQQDPAKVFLIKRNIFSNLLISKQIFSSHLIKVINIDKHKDSTEEYPC